MGDHGNARFRHPVMRLTHDTRLPSRFSGLVSNVCKSSGTHAAPSTDGTPASGYLMQAVPVAARAGGFALRGIGLATATPSH
jgi:hypothetical protein